MSLKTSLISFNSLATCICENTATGRVETYKVQWRQKDVDQEWASKTVANVSHFVVTGAPTFVPYEIKVQAMNEYGNGPDPEVVIGYSGEDCE